MIALLVSVALVVDSVLLMPWLKQNSVLGAFLEKVSKPDFVVVVLNRFDYSIAVFTRQHLDGLVDQSVEIFVSVVLYLRSSVVAWVPLTRLYKSFSAFFEKVRSNKFNFLLKFLVDSRNNHTIERASTVRTERVLLSLDYLPETR